MWERLLSIIDLVLSHWRLLALLIMTGLGGHFAEEGIDYVKQFTQEPQDNIEQPVSTPIVKDAPAPEVRTIERTIIREKDCGISEAMKSHIKALH